MTDVRLTASQLTKFAESLLVAGGFTTGEANKIAASLTLSEMMGHSSHGIMRVKEYLQDLKKGNIVSNNRLKIIHETSNSIHADAQAGPGQVVMPALLEKLIEKIETQAIVTASVMNSGHIGRIGEWVEKPAYSGYPALLLVNDNGTCFFVAPPGGTQSVTSTNPIAFAIPLANEEIFMADMSTSAIAFGKVKLARINKTSVATDCIQDANGQSTNDPMAFFADPPGSIMPMGGAAQGYKGFALSMFVDMLTAGLSGGQTPPAEQNAIKNVNNISLTLWNPKSFGGLEHMQKQAGKYINSVRTSKPIDPSKPIRLPGDRMNTLKQERQKNGIPLNGEMIKNLLTMADELNITPPVELTT